MQVPLRVLVLGAAVSLASGSAALAAQADHTPAMAGLNFTRIPLANGQSVYCRKAGGSGVQVFVLNRDGKKVPAPPGSYKQKNGNVFLIGNGGLVRHGSRVMLNPQPLPP